MYIRPRIVHYRGMTTPTTTTVELGALEVGDVVLRPFFGSLETIVAIEPRTPRARRYLTLRFASGNEWTNVREYRMQIVGGAR
jgi:hypothetical protein